MTSGRFVPFAAVATAVVSSTFLMLGPVGCDEDESAACTDDCPAVEGTYPLMFTGDAGLPAECANLNVQALPNGELLSIRRAEDGMLTATLAGVALTGQVYASGALNLTGMTPPISDGGLNTLYTVTATQTEGTEDGGLVPNSLIGNLASQYSRIEGTTSELRCNVARPFTATRQ